MVEIIGVILVIIVIYSIINGQRNRDPLNRKCAAEICEILIAKKEISPQEIADVFTTNARYNKQAGHIVSMVPALLIESGVPRPSAMSFVPLLRAAQTLIPK